MPAVDPLKLRDEGCAEGCDEALDRVFEYLDSELEAPDQTCVNLGANYVDPSHHWTFSVRVRNLFDKSYALLHTRIPIYGVNAVYYNPPRTLMFTARCDY